MALLGLIFGLERLAPRAPAPLIAVLDCSALTDPEYTALKRLTEAEERARHNRIMLWSVALNPDVRHVVERAPRGPSAFTLGGSDGPRSAKSCDP